MGVVKEQLSILGPTDLYILNEVDDGVTRTDYRDVGRELAEALKMNYAFGVEFIEVDPLNMGIDLPTIEAIKRFVSMGNGVALVPHLTIAHELAAGELVRITVDELEFKRVLRLVHRRHDGHLSHADLRHVGVPGVLGERRASTQCQRADREAAPQQAAS